VPLGNGLAVGHHGHTEAAVWAVFGLLAATLGALVAALIGLNTRIDDQGQGLGSRIDAQTGRIDAQTARIDALGGELRAYAAGMHAEFRALDLRLTRAGG
jgi:hypothetical protein